MSTTPPPQPPSPAPAGPVNRRAFNGELHGETLRGEPRDLEKGNGCECPPAVVIASRQG